MRLIDADALIDKYGDWYTEEGTEEGYIGTIKGIVDSMPTIKPVRKGYWMEDDNEMRVACSECGEPNDSMSDYCPNCGAKMEEGEQA